MAIPPPVIGIQNEVQQRIARGGGQCRRPRLVDAVVRSRPDPTDERLTDGGGQRAG